jgi:transposase-like protein
MLRGWRFGFPWGIVGHACRKVGGAALDISVCCAAGSWNNNQDQRALGQPQQEQPEQPEQQHRLPRGVFVAQSKYPRLVAWVEENIEETLTFYRLPRQHHKHLKSTNMLERLNEEIKRRTHVVRIFPNAESCLRLVRALCVETHENWLEAHRYLNMDYLRELKKEALRKAA